MDAEDSPASVFGLLRAHDSLQALQVEIEMSLMGWKQPLIFRLSVSTKAHPLVVTVASSDPTTPFPGSDWLQKTQRDPHGVVVARLSRRSCSPKFKDSRDFGLPSFLQRTGSSTEFLQNEFFSQLPVESPWHLRPTFWEMSSIAAGRAASHSGQGGSGTPRLLSSTQCVQLSNHLKHESTSM